MPAKRVATRGAPASAVGAPASAANAPAPAFVRPQQVSAGGAASADVLASILAIELAGVEPAAYGARKRELKLLAWHWRDAVTALSMETAVVSGIHSLRQLLAVCKKSAERARRIKSLSISLKTKTHWDPAWLVPVCKLIERCAPSLIHIALELDPLSTLSPCVDALVNAVHVRTFVTNQNYPCEALVRAWPALIEFDSRTCGGCASMYRWPSDSTFMEWYPAREGARGPMWWAKLLETRPVTDIYLDLGLLSPQDEFKLEARYIDGLRLAGFHTLHVRGAASHRSRVVLDLDHLSRGLGSDPMDGRQRLLAFDGGVWRRDRSAHRRMTWYDSLELQDVCARAGITLSPSPSVLSA